MEYIFSMCWIFREIGIEGMGEGVATYDRGGFLLFVGNVVSLFVMAAGSILVARARDHLH